MVFVMKEQRERDRLFSRELSELVVVIGTGESVLIGNVGNISEIGVGVLIHYAAASRLDIGSTVSGKITGTGFNEIRFEGVVARTEKIDYSDSANGIIGIRFLSEISLPARVFALSLTQEYEIYKADN